MAERTVTPTVIPNPDPSVVTTEAIDRTVKNTERVIDARIDGMEKAVQVFQADLTRVPTQLDRGIVGLRDVLEARLTAFIRDLDHARAEASNRADADMGILGTRLAGMDKAIELLQKTTDQMPEFVRDQVGQLRDLHGERFTSIDTGFIERDKRTAQSFDSIDTQFQERDKRTEQLSLADKTAIAAALQAQKEAAGATNESNGLALAKMETNFTKLIEQGSALVQSVSKNLDDKIADLKGRLDRGEGKTSISDPETTAKLNVLMTHMSSLSTTRDQHFGSEKTTSDNSARMMAIIAVVVVVIIGIAEIVARIAVH